MPSGADFDDPAVQSTPACTEGTGNPLEMISREHREHLVLCDKLEEIADSLPNNIDRHACSCAARALQDRVRVHHVIEEEGLFPLLSTRAGNDAEFMRSLQRLQDEHQTDEGYCDEVLELLTTLSNGNKLKNADAAGYLLRGLFECMRRHIAFEEEHVLPKAKEILDGSDLKTLALHMAKIKIGRR